MASVNALLARLEKLEAGHMAQSWRCRVVMVMDGETEEAAKARDRRERGDLHPGERELLILFVAVDPQQASAGQQQPSNVIPLR